MSKEVIVSEKQKETRYPSRWKKGESGNPAGRPPKGQSMTDLMEKYLGGVEEGQKKTRKELLVKKMGILAFDGDLNAMKLIWNYLDGMPKQTIDASISQSLAKLPEEELHEAYRAIDKDGTDNEGGGE